MEDRKVFKRKAIEWPVLHTPMPYLLVFVPTQLKPWKNPNQEQEMVALAEERGSQLFFYENLKLAWELEKLLLCVRF